MQDPVSRISKWGVQTCRSERQMRRADLERSTAHAYCALNFAHRATRLITFVIFSMAAMSLLFRFRVFGSCHRLNKRKKSKEGEKASCSCRKRCCAKSERDSDAWHGCDGSASRAHHAAANAPCVIADYIYEEAAEWSALALTFQL
eukprot:4479358-Prymnesium_polylepis.1